MKSTKVIGILGFGNMGSALALALSEKNWKVHIYDKDRKKSKRKKGIYVCKGASDLIKSSPVVVIAIKPQNISSLLLEIKDVFSSCAPLVITIAAGVSTSFFEKNIKGIRIVRVMPNLAVKIKQSVSFISKGKFASLEDLRLVENIFSCVGSSFIVKESLLNKVTAISGSGPGYVYYFMDAFYRSARALGFKKIIAKHMVIQTFLGAANLIRCDEGDFNLWIKNGASEWLKNEGRLVVF